jgi:hypothetical protein
MIEPAKAEHRRATSVYTIEFPGSSDDLDRAVAKAQEITTVSGSGLYSPNQAYLRVRVADDAVASYIAQEALGVLWPNLILRRECVIHTGMGPSRRIVQL